MALHLAQACRTLSSRGPSVFAAVTAPGEKVQGRITEADGKANTFLEQILSSIRIVQAFAAENVLIAKYDEQLHGVCIQGYSCRYGLLSLSVVSVGEGWHDPSRRQGPGGIGVVFRTDLGVFDSK